MFNSELSSKKIIAFVGMPGAGKSMAAMHLKEINFPVVRFGDITDEKLRELNLERNPANEEYVREQIRHDSGMDAYAVKSAQKIKNILSTGDIVIIDGLYSWEEYLYLKKEFPQLLIIHIFTQPPIRYQRLSSRSERPFSVSEAKIRDTREIEHLNKGGPIAIADYLIKNNGDITSLNQKIDELFLLLNIKV